jgi:hypothetical protein
VGGRALVELDQLVDLVLVQPPRRRRPLDQRLEPVPVVAVRAHVRVEVHACRLGAALPTGGS